MKANHSLLRADLVSNCDGLPIEHKRNRVPPNANKPSRSVDEETVRVRFSRNMSPHGASAKKRLDRLIESEWIRGAKQETGALSQSTCEEKDTAAEMRVQMLEPLEGWIPRRTVL